MAKNLNHEAERVKKIIERSLFASAEEKRYWLGRLKTATPEIIVMISDVFNMERQILKDFVVSLSKRDPQGKLLKEFAEILIKQRKEIHIGAQEADSRHADVSLKKSLKDL